MTSITDCIADKDTRKKGLSSIFGSWRVSDAVEWLVTNATRVRFDLCASHGSRSQVAVVTKSKGKFPEWRLTSRLYHSRGLSVRLHIENCSPLHMGVKNDPEMKPVSPSNIEVRKK